jgi:hypothetical protein
MDTVALIAQLEREWDQSEGFLGRLRTGVFDQQGFQRLKTLLEGIRIPEETEVDRRLVALLWFMPVFMLWQRERVARGGSATESEVDAAAEQVASLLLAQILGGP